MKNRTLLFFVLILILCACCVPAGALLPSYSLRGSVVDYSRANNTVTILVTHKWGCVYDGRENPCSWIPITPRTLTGTVPVPEVFDHIGFGSPVMAGSIGTQGERWTSIGTLTPFAAPEPYHATHLFGDLGLLPAPLVAGYGISATTKPDCGECSGSVCTARWANVTITREGTPVWNGTLLPYGEMAYDDPHDGSGISVTFVSGQASSNLCPGLPVGMSGIQPISVFIVSVRQPGPGPTVTPAKGCFLSISSVPSGATILLDGINRGQTSQTISGLDSGEHQVVLEKDGYAPYEKTVILSPGRPAFVVANLARLYGSLRIQSTPSGAAVFLNGTAAGVTPLVIGDLLPGEYTVTLSKTGYVNATRMATVSAGQEKFVIVALSPKKDGSEKVDAFVRELQAEGFIVQQGKLEKFDVLAMYDAHVIPSCYGNNPSTPYLAYKLPAYPGLGQRGGRVSDAPVKPENRGLWLDYFMEPDEAIVYVGPTPPEVKYFSYRSYIGTRWFPDQNTYQRIFASLGDTINNVRIRTGIVPGQTSTGPYNKPIMIITTADKGTNDRVKKAAVRAGYSTGMMNDDIIPSGLIRMGLGNTSDTITFVHRLAFFANETLGNDYVNSTPGYVFRLTPTISQAPQPYGVPRLIVRGTGDCHELDLLKDQEALRDAIIARYGDGMIVTENKTDIWVLEGYDSLQRETDSLGDNRDALYLRNGDYLLAMDDFIIVYGVNHRASGKAIYTNVALYGTKALNGVVAVTDAEYEGTALSYLPGDPNAGLFYVWKFARNCNGEEGCTEVPTCCGGLGIPPDIPVRIGFRSYIEKETGIGPSFNEILYDGVIHFSPA
ncbi:MAG: PEGA domain-containing protein [Methanolinea sp.]|nr:PEGA domain-containing protein [Methanolinea sp.]